MNKATKMLMAVVMFTLAFASTAWAQAESDTVSVTFTVNTSTVPDTVNAENYSVYINGAIKGAGAGQAFAGGETITWDANATATLANVGGDYWSATYKMVAGDTLLYKYRYKNDLLNESDDENGFATTNNPAGWDTRGMVVTADTVLPVQYYNDRSDSPEPGTLAPFTSKEDTLTVFFRVNVGSKVQQNSFDPEVNKVAITGTPEFFGNAGDWSTPKFYLEPEFTRGADVFYSGVVRVQKDTAAAIGSAIYKFILTDADGAITAWDSDPNREITVPAADTTIHWDYFQREAPILDPLYDVNVAFEVSVGFLEGLGYFSSSVGDKLEVRGDDPMGWGTSDNNQMTFDDLDLSWKLTFPYTKAEGAVANYKYYINYDASRSDTSSPNYIEAIDIGGADFGYEEPISTAGGNRLVTFGTAPTQSAADDGEKQNFNDVSTAAVINAEDTPGGTMAVTFSIDMTNAMADSLSRPFNPATDSLYLQLESKFTALTNDIVSGGGFFDESTQAEYEFLRYKPTGEGNIYEVTLDMKFPTLNDFGYVVRYGVPSDPLDEMQVNGGGFAAGRRYLQFIQPLSSEYIGFDPLFGETYDVSWPATFKMPTVEWKASDLPYESQPDYKNFINPIEDLDEIGSYQLMQNYPNPFNPTTNISFVLPNAATVQLTVFNVLGQEVAKLVNNKTMTSGSHSVAFDASALSSGMYIYRLEAGNFVSSKRMMLIK